MSQFETFNASKAEIIGCYDRLEAALRLLDPLTGVEEDIQQIGKARLAIDGDTLCIALLGAFSDGKTSVAAGWLGEVMPDMKIDADESSDTLAHYSVEGLEQKVTIIDTPGLFGDKVTEGLKRYDDVTRDFIAQAHIVLYVVDATNPVKDSHREALRWVMRDLGKLDSTIFVINKMDEVADLRDSLDFEEHAHVKRDAIIGKLIRYLDLNEAEASGLHVACVAANPGGRDMEFWLGDDEKNLYEHRSRIGDLRQLATAVLATGSREVLLRKASTSVLQDIVRRRLDSIASGQKSSDELAAALSREIERLQKDLAAGERDVLDTAARLNEELWAMESKLLARIRALEREDVPGFVEDEIGLTDTDAGFRLRIRIERKVQQCSQQSLRILEGVRASIDHTLASTSEVLDRLTSSALSGSSKALGALGKLPPATIKAGIFAARDALSNVTGWVIKFKPWEATKYANNIAKFAGPVSAGLQLLGDAVSVLRGHQAEKELAAIKAELTTLVKLHFQSVYDFLSVREKVIEAFAPQLAEFHLLLAGQIAQLGEVEQQVAAVQAVREALLPLTEGRPLGEVRADAA